MFIISNLSVSNYKVLQIISSKHSMYFPRKQCFICEAIIQNTIIYLDYPTCSCSFLSVHHPSISERRRKEGFRSDTTLNKSWYNTVEIAIEIIVFYIYNVQSFSTYLICIGYFLKHLRKLLILLQLHAHILENASN